MVRIVISQMHHLTKREGYTIATYEPFWLVILGICQIECKVNEGTKQMTDTQHRRKQRSVDTVFYLKGLMASSHV